MAQLGREHLEEIDDPESGIERMLEYYHRKGYSDSWINQRFKSIEVRKELTDEWERRGIKKRIRICRSDRYHHAGMGRMTTKQYKQYKGLKTIWSWSLIACGSHYDRNIEREETEDDHRKQNDRPAGRSDCREHPQRDRG